MSAILFVARHVWPSQVLVGTLQQLVKILVWGSWDGVPCRAWMGECQAELPADEGGIQLPNARASLLYMAGFTVGRRATGSTGVGRLVRDILLAERLGLYTYLTPGHGDDVGGQNSWDRTMCEAGDTVVRDAFRALDFVADIAIICASAMTLRSNWLDAQWVDGDISFTVDETSL